MQASSKQDKSLGELFSDLTRELGVLVRQELDLAKTEMSQKAARVGKDIAFLAVGGAILYAGFLALLATIIIVLATVGLPWWLAALIVTVVVLAAGGFLVMKGKTALSQENLAPRQTIASLQEDVQWAKEQVS